jgi:hypothetical protein
LDFKDYVQPFKNTIKIIHRELFYDETESKSFKINLQQAKLRE